VSPLVVKIFWPFRMTVSPSTRPRERRSVTADPASGSVMAIVMSRSPRRQGAR
jgi:hypothetical protein